MLIIRIIENVEVDKERFEVFETQTASPAFSKASLFENNEGSCFISITLRNNINIVPEKRINSNY